MRGSVQMHFKFEWLQIVLILLLCTGVLSAQTPQETTTDLGTRRFGFDWPTFLGPTGNSKSSETGISKDWSGDGLPTLWSMPLTLSYGTCTVSRGRVFQFDAVPKSRVNNLGVLHCRNSETGEKIWEFEYPYEYADQYGYNNGPRTSPIVDDDRVYIYGVDGTLVCVDFATGKKVWAVDTSKDYGVIQNFFGVGSNPVIVGDNVIVMVGGSPKPTRIDLAQGNGSGIVAFDKRTGEEKYRFSDQLASYASLVSVESDRAWCFAFMRGGLLAFDPNTGKEDFLFPWRARILESVNASVPIVFDNQVFLSETYGPGSALLDFSSVKDGQPKVVWRDEEKSRDKSMQTHWNTPIFHDGYIYGSSGRHSSNAELRCIDATTGKVMWSEPGLARASLMFVDGHFVVLSETGQMRLLKATEKKFDQISQKIIVPALRSPAWAAPVLSHGLLYVRGKDRLVCLELIAEKD